MKEFYLSEYHLPETLDMPLHIVHTMTASDFTIDTSLRGRDPIKAALGTYKLQPWPYDDTLICIDSILFVGSYENCSK